MKRREYLIGTGAVGVAAIAGCTEQIEPNFRVSSIEPPALNAGVFRTIEESSRLHVFEVQYDTSFGEYGEPDNVFLMQENEIVSGISYEDEEVVRLRATNAELDDMIRVVCDSGDEEYGTVMFERV